MPRCQGPWVPAPSRTGVFGPPPFFAIPTLHREYLLVKNGNWASFSLGCHPGLRVVPLFEKTVLGSPPFSLAEVTLFQRGTASDKIEPCRLEAGTITLAVRKRSIFLERCCS